MDFSCSCCNEESTLLIEIYDTSCESISTEGQVDPECKRLCRYCVVGKIVPVHRMDGWQLGEVRESTHSDQHVVEFPDGVRDVVMLAEKPYSDYLEYHCKKRPHDTNDNILECPYQHVFDTPFNYLDDQILPPSSPIVRKRPRLDDVCIAHKSHLADGVLDCEILEDRLSPLSAASIQDIDNQGGYSEDTPAASLTALYGTPSRTATKNLILTPARKVTTNLIFTPARNASNNNTPARNFETSSHDSASNRLLPSFSTLGRSTPRRKRDGTPRKALPKIWTKKEDTYLTQLVENGIQPIKWTDLALMMGDRSGKQCRERYLNHLTPKLRVEEWSPLEDALLCRLYQIVGSKWALMAKVLKGRTDNNIKNRFHHIRRRLEKDVSRIIKSRDVDEVAGLININDIRHSPLQSEMNSDFAIKVHQILPYLAADTVREDVDHMKFGFFYAADGEWCTRCNFIVPSIPTGRLISTETGWCETCTKVPPYVVGDMLRQCLSLRKHNCD